MASIVSEVRRLVNDEGTFWPLTQVLDAVNQAQLMVEAQVKWRKTSWTLSVGEGAEWVPVPTGVLIPMWVEGPTGGTESQRFYPTTHWHLETNDRGWRRREMKRPEGFVLWDAYTFRIWPRADQAYTYTLWGVGIPTEVEDILTISTLPHNLTSAVTLTSAALLLASTRPDIAEMYFADAEELIADYRRVVRNAQSHNIQVIRPATRVDLQQGGDLTPRRPLRSMMGYYN
jgi:hypothetical protein